MEIKNIIIILLVIIILYCILNEKITYAISRYLNYKIIQIPAKANVRNLLLISNSREDEFGRESYFYHCKSNIKKFLKKKNEILFIAYGGASIPHLGEASDYDKYTKIIKKDIFDPLNIRIKSLHHIKNTYDKQSAILNAECIFMSGGNSFKLMSALETHNLVGSLKRAVAKGVPYIGVSSGTVVVNPTLHTSRSIPILNMKTFQGLDLIPFYINVHYYEKLGVRLNQYLLQDPTQKILAIPEGAGVHIVGNKGELVGFGDGELLERRAGRFLRKKLKSGANISFLL
jgi:dipeptidase E